MWKKAIAIFTSVTVLMGILLLSVSAQNDGAIGWYCVRNKEHKQPVLDSNMKFIEELDGFYIDKKHGDESEEKIVYLTFDAGYENGNVEKILDVLKQNNVKGAFFILGNLIKRNPELVIRMADEGHTVCNHTYSHKDMTKIENIDEFRSELESLNKLYFDVTGREMSSYYRPPEGKFDRRSMEFASSLGYKTIFWSIAYADWDNEKQPSSEFATAKIMDHIHNGAIILLHPTSATNVQILPNIIAELKTQGYTFGTLDELTLSGGIL